MHDVFTVPVGQRSPVRHAVVIYDRANDGRHVVDAGMVGILQHQELPGHVDMKMSALHVLQNHVGEFKDAQVVGKGLTGLCTDPRPELPGQAGFAKRLAVNAQYFHLGKLPAIDLVGDCHDGHVLVV